MNEDQIIVLSDGRKFGYAEYGDPKGKPVFYFHGWPSSRLQAAPWDVIAKKLKARIISLDRPGFGLSDFHAKRKLLDWPDTVVEFANKLHIKKFAVVGVSGGGPYAAVCAYKIPERITKAAIVVGLAPTNIAGVLEGISFFNKLDWRWYHTFPFLMQFSSLFLLANAKKLIPNKFSPQFNAKADRAVLSSSDSLQKNKERNSKEAFKQGKKGAAHDLKIYTDDYGFRLKDIKAKVYLFYGDADKNVSLNMGKYYASQIPGNKLTIYPNEGHLISITHAEEILKALIH